MITNEMERRITTAVRNIHTKRVLCYAPYNMWALHGMWEMTILHGLRLRGADVRYVLCDSLHSERNVFWSATNPGHSKPCSEWQVRVTKLVNDIAILFSRLGRYCTLNTFLTPAAGLFSCPSENY